MRGTGGFFKAPCPCRAMGIPKKLSSFPVTWLEVPLMVPLAPVLRDPVPAAALRNPMAFYPNVPMSFPHPVSWGPDVASARRRCSLDTRRRRSDLDVDADPGLTHACACKQADADEHN